MSRLKHFKTLLWKNWVLQKRKYCVSIFEIILPLCFWGIIMIIAGIDVSRRGHTDLQYSYELHIDGQLDFYDRHKANIILYTPNNTVTTMVVDHLIDKMGRIHLDRSYDVRVNATPIYATGVGVLDEKEILNEYIRNSRVLAGFVFDETFTDLNAMTGETTVTLRLPSRAWVRTRWNTDVMYPRYIQDCREMLSNGNYENRFMPLQYGIMASIIELRNPMVNMSDDVEINLQCMPGIKGRFRSFVLGHYFGVTASVLLVFSYLLNAVQITKSVVLEKQKKLKMWLEMMGVGASTQWAAWFVKWFMQTTILSIILTVLGVIPLGTASSVLMDYEPSLFFLLLMCYSLALISFCFMISTFFQKASHATVACAVFSILLYTPFVAIHMRYEYISVNAKLAASLLFNVGLGLGCEAMNSYHMTGVRVDWSNFHRPPSLDQDFSLLLAMVMLLVDSVLYLFIAWYVEGVYPGPNGVARPWNFPFTKSYWRGHGSPQVYPNKSVERPLGSRSEFFQPDPTDKELGIAILGLRKVFGSGEAKKVAVDDMVLNVYKGHITALLGHNGAGKTTTLSMLTGFLPSTSGTAIVDGYDVNENARDVTRLIGLCPQHDVLFDGLTVQEHIRFFCQLKHGTAANSDTVHTVMWDLGLGEQKNTVAERLSGGQKRKLSVAIALCTSSQIVILDEPTSGMDPQSRRQVWTTLQRHKADKAILFTTHNMDEADALSDRVAIMSEGLVKCSGSPLFLKNKFGVGYHLVISKAPNCDALSIKTLVQEHVPPASESYNYPSSLMMTLPTAHLAHFHNLFLALEDQKERLGIHDFSTSFTTLEDVFLRVGQSDWIKDSDLYKQSDNSGPDNLNSGNDTENVSSSTLDLTKESDFSPGQYLDFNDALSLRTGFSLSFQQFVAGLYKKFLLSLRNPFIFVVQILTVVVLSSMTYGILISNWEEEPAINLDMKSLWWENKVAYSFNPQGNQTKDFVNRFLDTLHSTKAESIRVNFTNPGLLRYLLDKLQYLGIGTFSRQYFMGFDIQESSSSVEIRGMFDGYSYHGPPIVLSQILNGIYKHYIQREAGIRFVNHPLPPKDEIRTGFDFVMFISPVVLTFILGLVSSTFIVLLLRERNTRSKHVQIVSGLKPWVYWMSTFAWDFLNMGVAMLCLMIVMAVFRVEAHVDDGRLGYVFVVLMMYCWAVLPYTYLWSFAFRTPTCGFVVIIFLNILFGPAILSTLIVLDGLVYGSVAISMANVILSIIFPNFAVGISLANMLKNYQFSVECQRSRSAFSSERCLRTCWDLMDCRKPQENYLAIQLPGVGIFVIIMFFQGIVCFLLTLAAEYNIRHKSNKNPDNEMSLSTEDEDVVQERTRIKTDSSGIPDSLILHQLSKTYTKHTALHNLSLGVGQGECFGLLGVNGAGKTTLFNILTGEKRKYGGEAIINRHSVNTNIRQAYGTVGYCPQKDALFHQLTGREVLTYFSRVKGISGSRIKSVVDELLKVLYLNEYSDTLTEYYSYGNQRKLSTAIALLGDPQMLLLDEPTAGVDPVAKRRLWNVLTDVRAAGRTLILTSHSMEECDVLCSRVGILVKGRLLCLGSPRHLKNKFGQGYTLTIRIKTSAEERPVSRDRSEGDVDTIELMENTEWVRFQGVDRMVKTAFTHKKKISSTDDTVKYCLLDPNLALSYVFRTLEGVKDDLGIADYSVSQSSLEDVFLRLSNTQPDQGTNV